ncbi:T9SS type A sorting domain-containing protein [Cytophagales bacterium LB-30]|uniref:T9SS type A sorting domain-containing protein n=1 Tax=Shiella aurantiaca TaxID=3058365 RepID=A0ABT8F7Y3_9BACT|nr:T9SS type A sorting domain-containing protein [Shiella aurantiaca]MDN4166603.1 T9SS type A sorting domain-containing protein [Shiella aurantiaca]
MKASLHKLFWGSLLIVLTSSPLLAQLTSASVGGTATICEGASTNLTFTMVGGAGPYDVEYTDGTDTFQENGLLNGGTVSVNPTVNTSYSIVSVTDTDDLISIGVQPGTATITVNPTPTAALSGTATICEGNSTDLTFTLTGNGPFDVEYSDGTNTFLLNSINDGHTEGVSPTVNTSYSLVSVTDNSTPACVGTLSGTAIITVNPTPTATLSGTATMCEGSSTDLTFTLTGNGPFDVEYSDGTNTFLLNSINDGHTEGVSPTVNTSYSLVSVTDNSTPACTGTLSGSAVITVRPLPSAGLSGSATICEGEIADITIDIDQAGVFDIEISDGSTTAIIQKENGQTISYQPSTTTIYSIVSIAYTDAPTCSVAGNGIEATLTVNPLPTGEITGSTSICEGSSADITFVLTGNGPFDVEYTDGTNTTLLSGINSGEVVSVSPNITTDYTITSITDSSTPTACSVASGTADATITVLALPSGSISGNTIICAGQSTDITFNLTGVGPFDVSYTDGTSTFDLEGIYDGHTEPVSPTVTTTYSITAISDANTPVCSVASGTGQAVITVNEAPTAGISGTVSICPGETATLTFDLTGQEPFDISYTDGTTQYDLFNISNGHTVDVNPSATTTYSILSITDDNTPACTVNAGIAEAIITVNTPPTAVLSGNASICNGSSTPLTFTLTGVGPFDVTYRDVSTNTEVLLTGISNGHQVSVSPTSTRSYQLVSVTDSNSPVCSGNVSGTASISVTDLPQATLSGTAQICAGESTDLLFTIVGGGTYNVVYTDGTSSFPLNNISSGHTVSVSPTNNTTYSLVSVQGFASPFCVGTVSGTAVVSIEPQVQASISGTTTLCEGESTLITFSFDDSDAYNVILNDGTQDIALNAITNNFTYEVTPAATTTYALTSVEEANAPICAGAITGSAVTVTVNEVPTALLSGNAAICEGSSTNLTFDLTGNGPFDVEYSDGTNTFLLSDIVDGHTESVSPSASTSYTLISVSDNNTPVCTGTVSGSADVVVNTLPSVTLSGSTTLCLGEEAELIFTLSGAGPFDVVYTDGTDNFELLDITNGHAIFLSPEVTTTYSLVSVTDSNIPSCQGNLSGSAVVTVNQLPTAVLSGGATLCEGESTALSFSLTGVGPFDVVYSDGQNQFTLNDISNGHSLDVSPNESTTYSLVSVQDAQSPVCSGAVSGTAVVSVNAKGTASISGSTSLCAGESGTLNFSLSGVGPFDVVYSDGTSNITLFDIADGHQITVSPTATTIYSLVSVQDSQVPSCPAVASGSAVVVVNELPQASLSGGGDYCVGEAAVLVFGLQGFGPFDVVYTDGTEEFTLTNITNNHFIQVSPTETTTYSLVSVHDANTPSCSGTLSGEAVVVIDEPTFASLNGSTTLCAGDAAILTFDLQGIGPFDVTYTDGTSEITLFDIADGHTLNVSPSQTTNYLITQVVGSGAGVCEGNIIDGATVTVQDTYSALISGDALICAGTSAEISVNLTGQAPWTIEVTDGTTTTTYADITASPFTIKVSPSSTRTYFITSVADAANTACGSFTGLATVNVQGVLENNTLIQPANELNCGAIGSFVITGALPTGGDGTYAYTWQRRRNGGEWANVGSNQNLSENPITQIGLYEYRRLVNSGLCDSESNIVSLQVSPPITNNLIEDPTNDVFCDGNVDFLLEGNVPNGADESIVYTWQRSADEGQSWEDIGSGQTYQEVATLTSGIYQFRRVVNTASCPSENISNVIRIQVLEPLSANSITEPENLLFCASAGAQVLEASAVSGGQGIQIFYAWETLVDGVWEEIPMAIEQNYEWPGSSELGVYTFRRRAYVEACESISNEVLFEINENPQITGFDVQAPGRNQNNGSITVEVSGGTSPYFYAWSTGATTAQINQIGAGSYQVTVTDSKGCSAQGTQAIEGVLGIGEEWVESLKLYPNPSRNILNLQIAFGKPESGQLRLLSLEGKEVMLRSFEQVLSADWQLDVSSLPAGQYLVRIESQTQVIHRKFTKLP